MSRNRYWGTPIPLWVSDDLEEIVCVGSIAELEELSGIKGINDLHRDKIDHITIPSKQGKGQLKRVEEIFGWLKTIGGLRKTRYRGVARVDWMFSFALAAYNLVRMRNLLPAPA